MKNKISTIFFCIILTAFNVYANDFFSFSVENINKQFTVNTNYKINIKINNINNKYQISIDSIKYQNINYGFEYQITYQKTTLNPGEIYSLDMNLKSLQNLNYNPTFYVYYQVPQLRQSLVEILEIPLSFVYNDLYDAFSQGKKGLPLKTALSNYVDNHKSFTYKESRTFMFSSFDNVDGWVECVYTGEKLQTTGIPDVNTTHFNNEHTWPQSKGADSEPPKSDIFHCYVTNETANTKRGDTQFGNVVSNISWEKGGSKLGNDANGNLRFEPRDSHKGNVARSMFYFAIRYGNQYGYLTPQEEVLRQWMNVDPVDAKEMKRNDNIASVQGKRNPFIDHPEFLQRIFSISKDEDFPKVNSLAISEKNILVSTYFLESTYDYKVLIKNNGNSDLVITSVSFSNPNNDPIIESITPVTNYFLQVDSSLVLTLNLFENKNSKTQNSLITINTNYSEKITIPVEEFYYNSINDFSENEISIYPNPIEDILVINGISNDSQQISFEIFDCIGNLYLSGNRLPSNNKIELNLNLKNGIYFVRLSEFGKSIILPFQIIK